MASTDLSQIASFASAFEAEQIRALLEENGVRAFVDGAEAQTALAYVGTALGGVKLLVQAGDAARALEIIDRLGAPSDELEDAWFCGRCEEVVDAGFDVCWSCGEARADVEQPLPAATVGDPATPAAGAPEHFEEATEPDEFFEQDRFNPFASPRVNTPGPTISEDEDAPIDPEAEAMLLRAWRASVLGLVFFPLITHLYSMYLLMRAAALSSKFSPAGTRRFYLAFALNLFVGFLAGLFFWVLRYGAELGRP